ncbi:MAG: hypothetical protein FWE30_04570 [Bacteroidales bacterium]|nr:hypothetical protein [Bacteroidales bacterium]
MSATQRAILESLGGSGKMTAKDIVSNIGKDTVTIERAIKKGEGLLTRVGSDKTG